MAINTEITRIQGAKADIKSAIEAKGVSVPSNALIDTYDDYVAQISGGGGNQDLIDLIERDITTLTIPSGVTRIGYAAFQYCDKLTSVTIPSSVEFINSYAFAQCVKLTSVTIPSGVTGLGGGVFMYCTLLTSVTIPSGVTIIPDSTFRSCESLLSVTIPSGVTEIGQSAFESCRALTTVTIPSGVTTIGRYAFRNIDSLTSITCEATTPPTFGYYMLSGDTNLAHIYVPASSVETYKTTSGWSDYASIIEAIPSA